MEDEALELLEKVVIECAVEGGFEDNLILRHRNGTFVEGIGPQSRLPGLRALGRWMNEVKCWTHS